MYLYEKQKIPMHNQIIQFRTQPAQPPQFLSFVSEKCHSYSISINQIYDIDFLFHAKYIYIVPKSELSSASNVVTTPTPREIPPNYISNIFVSIRHDSHALRPSFICTQSIVSKELSEFAVHASSPPSNVLVNISLFAQVKYPVLQRHRAF